MDKKFSCILKRPAVCSYMSNIIDGLYPECRGQSSDHDVAHCDHRVIDTLQSTQLNLFDNTGDT